MRGFAGPDLGGGTGKQRDGRGTAISLDGRVTAIQGAGGVKRRGGHETPAWA